MHIHLFFLLTDAEDAVCPPESLIASGILMDLSGEAAKLKAMNALSQVK